MKCADIISNANKFTILKEISEMIRFLNIWTNKLRVPRYPKDHKYEMIKTPPIGRGREIFPVFEPNEVIV